jgi:hypothetical protein
MDKTALVGLDVDKGSRILQILDDAQLELRVALWAYLDEYGDWRLVLSSRKFDELDIRKAFGLIHEALDAAGVSLEETPILVILRMNDPFIKTLRRIFGKTKSVEGMRLGSQSIGNRFLDDAFVYRIS